MDSTFIVCGGCSSRLKIPATLAPGKKVKCPKCGGLVTVSAAPQAGAAYGVAVESRPAATVPVSPRATRARMPQASAEPDTKACPFCGEQILESASKCRHCGEFLDEKKAVAAARARPGRGPAGDPNSEMNPAEYAVAILGFPVGLIIGIVWLIRKMPKAKDMLKLSVVSTFIAAAGGFGFWEYKNLWNPHGALPTAPIASDYRPPPEEYFLDPDDPRGRPQGRPPDLGGADATADLTGQPPHIQRAMRSIVLVVSQTQNSLGSGVVIQRDGKEALIVTNRHVVDSLFAFSHGEAGTALKDFGFSHIRYLNVEQKEPGRVIWVAPEKIDLAIVRASCPDDFEAVPWQASGHLIQGETVFAIGHPRGLGWSMTKGVVSALRLVKLGGREVPTIQTDAAITHGNSGGGLFNDKGELVGVNTFIVDPGSGGSLGFSIRTMLLAEFKPNGLKIPEASAASAP